MIKVIPPYTIAGGNPIKQIKPRFDDEMIELLQAVCWWDFDEEQLVEFLPTLCNEDINTVRQILRQLLKR